MWKMLESKVGMFTVKNTELFEKEKDSRKLWCKLYLKKLDFSSKSA